MNETTASRSGEFSRIAMQSRKVLFALLAAAPLLWSATPLPLLANSAPILISQNQRQGDWDATLHMARLVNEQQRVTALVLQLDLLNKPETTYANVVYQVFAKSEGRWKEIFTNEGARLITNTQGRFTLATETISIQQIREELDDENIDLETAELKAVAQIRYDVRGGRRDRRVEWETVQVYNAIATTRTTQVITATRNTTTQVTTRTNTSDRIAAGHFSLAIRQARVTLPEVVARVSIKPRRRDQFVAEQYIGDFRYRMNQRAEFVQGLSAGDRVVVRLFTLNNRLIGYSEFELLSNQAAVTLVLPDDPASYGTVRTVYGVDGDRNGSIDANTTIYDYFTQVSGRELRETRVTFLQNTRTISTRLFQVQGLPSVPRDCSYTASFLRGSFALVSRTVSIFSRNLTSIFTSLPGSVVNLISLNTSRISVYEVRRLIVSYERYQIRDGYLVIVDRDRDCDRNCRDDRGHHNNDDDDDDDHDDDDRRGRRRGCNQGIGNGPEGCDPGNSRPHGGSNDEGGRRPGRRR